MIRIGRVGVVGDGALAASVAGRLAALGYQVHASLGHGAAAPLVAGVTQVGLPADAAEDAGLVVVAMNDETGLEDAVFGDGGVTETLADGGAVLDVSSVSAAFSLRAAGRLSALGLTWLEGALVGESAPGAPWPLVIVGVADEATADDLDERVLKLAGRARVIHGLGPVTQIRRLVQDAEPAPSERVA